jgi:hypothetical protein
MQMMSAANTPIEYRFSTAAEQRTCPLCGNGFRTRIGSWPHLPETGEPVCGRAECPVGDEVVRAAPCDTLFRFAELAEPTLAVLRRGGGAGVAVAEQFRRASLEEGVPDRDRQLLQLAAIDLQYCQADGTRIESLDAGLVLRTCGEAAAEMLLSGCGDIV